MTVFLSDSDCLRGGCPLLALRRLAPARRHAFHVGQAVGDALMAIDAGTLAAEQEALVDLCGPRVLPGDVHRLGAVAVAAFERVVRLQSRPFVLSQPAPVVDELVAGVDRAEDVA